MNRKLVISTLSIGKIYEIYTRYLFKKIRELGITDIIFFVTSDNDFSDKLIDSNVRVEFNLLEDHSINNSRASTGVYRSTIFKYYLKSLAIKNAAIKFPHYHILHIDCDSIPDEKFNLESIYGNSDAGIYCGEFVTCSGHYGITRDESGEIQVNKKIPHIFGNFLKHVSEQEIHDLKFPIENKLLFNNISPEKIISFCDNWYEIGQSVNESGLPTYGDCFEIKASAIINNIQIFKTDSLYFGDSHKNTLLDELKKIGIDDMSNVGEDFIKPFLDTLPTQSSPRKVGDGFVYAGDENSSYSSEFTYNAAYGAIDSFKYKFGITGEITFNNQTFGDPIPYVVKKGYVSINNKAVENEKLIIVDPVVKIRCFGAPFDINFSSCSKIKPVNFSWSNQDHELNVYIDNAIAAGIHHGIKNKDKTFGWICESKMIAPHITEDVLINYKKYKNIYSKIFTYDQELIKLDPEFFEYCFAGSNYPWTPRDEFRVHKKTKLVSFLSSDKNMCSGHAYRLEWANRLNGLVDFYGGVMGGQIIGGSHSYGHNKKTEALKDYMFSIVIENCKMDTYFTEKITDCFANGTIPIYFGTDNMGSIFNPDGIIVLNENFDVSMLTEELYYSKMQAIRDNLEIVKNMPLADEMLYEKITEIENKK
jgi:hypothetical protein